MHGDLEKVNKQSILHQSYYDNGQLKQVGAIIDSLRQGYWITYDSLGNIKAECIYVDDKLNGIFNLYYENGSPKVLGYMYLGDWVGERTFYYSNGNVKNKGYYKGGELDSIWENYEESGKLDKIIQYNKGEKIKILKDNKLTPPFP